MVRRKNDSIENMREMKLVKKEKRLLAENEYVVLKNIKSEVGKMTFTQKSNLRKDGWEVNIIINNKKARFFYGEHGNDNFGVLLETIIKYSPIKIDIHSWS